MASELTIPHDLQERWDRLQKQAHGSKAQQKYARFQIALIERITSLKAQVARLSAPVSREEVNDYEVSYEGDTVSEWFDRTIAARAELAKERP
jgi:ribosome-binding ATPase YchF (GTP1/OBG family)